MWSQIVLCVLVGLAYASNNPGWKPNTEYIYEIDGRTLSSLYEVSNQYSGLVLKGQLYVTPKPDGVLLAKIANAQYAQIHTELPEGWQSHIPDSEVSYKPLPLSKKPFQIVTKDGVIRDIIVEKDVQNWEANIIKSIASQFQMDTKGVNLIPSHVNKLPESGKNDAVFKTMEETITGNTETLYEIHPLPEYIYESQPWLAPQAHLKGDGEIIEVVKHKNYSRSEDRPAYHYGFASMQHWEPSGNQMGKFFVRNAISRAVLSGNLNRYTIQNSYTINEIVMSPTMNDKQKGSVVSLLNVTLSAVRQQTDKPEELTYPQSLETLVYSYNSPFEPASGARSRKQYDARYYKDESIEGFSSSEEELEERYRLQNSAGRFRSYQMNWENPRDSSSSEDYYQTQPVSPMTKAPESPLLPYTMGSYGQSIKNKDLDVLENVQKLAREIGQELQQPMELLKENGLNKFTILTSLIRIMDVDELQKSAEQLYSQQEKGQERYAWVAFRDAVAQAGTGPAALTVQKWIEAKKVQHHEASQLVATMAFSVRQPSEEYMKKFFDFVKKPEVQEQYNLNATAVLAYTNLLRKVYVNKYQSHNQFPVHSFGSFYTKEGREFLKNTVIPYLSEKLHEAIAVADTHKTHVYIRALGNVAHKKILEAFEPYLEGQKQASQFQRLMMVLHMHKLAEANPVIARSVLMKIYQNTGETQEIRAAAVYQLMCTSPPTDVLQRMASYTNIDTHEHVNAAVKSSIEAASQLEDDDHKYLRSSAQAAKPLLTKKIYGVQHGYDFLRSYVVEELNMEYNQRLRTIGSEDAYFPKGLKYSLRPTFGGLKRHIVDVEAALSSIDDLVDVIGQQTQYYQEAQQQKQSNQQQKWSSESIAKLLNLQSYEREQLEGIMRFEMGAFEHLFSFDNQSISDLPEVVRKMEESLKNGKTLQHTKIINNGEMALAFPTETGFPFLFTYDTPTLINIEGKIEASASPAISKNGKLYKPQKVESKFSGHVTVSTKIQSRLTFITPFDKQQYMAGLDKNMQAHIPVYGKAEIDTQQGQVKTEFEFQEPHKDAPLFHYSTWPYTSKVDITNMKPVMGVSNTQPIIKKNAREYNNIVTLPSTGISFEVQYRHAEKFVNLDKLRHLFVEHDFVSALLGLWDDASIQQSLISVRFVPEQSQTKKVVVQMGYSNKHVVQPQRGDSAGYKLSLDELSKMSSESKSRQEEFMNRVGGGISSAHLYSLDASAEFQGSSAQYKYRLTAAFGKSNVDPKSAILAYFERIGGGSNDKRWQSGVYIKNTIPNTNGLDMDFAMEHEPTMKSYIEHMCGANDQSATKIQAEVELHRTQERKRYLTELPAYAECKRQIQEGNRQLPACLNMTIRAGFFDSVDVKINYDNVRPEMANRFRDIYELARVYYYPTLEEDSSSTEQQKAMSMQLKFHPDFDAVNVSLKTHEKETKIKDIELNYWMRKYVAVHPVFHLLSRIESQAFGLEQFRQFCVVDQTAAKTFNNRTYPLDSLEDKWTVMMMYVPKRACRDPQQHGQHTAEEQLKEQIENYAVLVRRSPGKQQAKEVKIIAQSPQTEQKVVDITLTPSGTKPAAKVHVNGQEVQIDDKKSYDEFGDYGDYVQIYEIGNGEVKAEVRGKFYVIYDGSRARLGALSYKLRDSTRGLCGTLNDEPADDFLTADNCVVGADAARDFVNSYVVEGGAGGRSRRSQSWGQGGDRAGQCSQVYAPLYVDVISDRDAGRDEQQPTSESSCLKLQTRYIEQNGEICFTVRPVPVCACRQRGTAAKNVPMHCVQKSNAALLWKDQINKGGSPDFSNKVPTKTVQMQLPQGCSR